MKKVFTVRIEEETLKRLRALQARTGATPAAQIRLALGAWLDAKVRRAAPETKEAR